MADAESLDASAAHSPAPGSGRLLAQELTALALAGLLLSGCHALALVASSGRLEEHVYAPWTWRPNPQLTLQVLASGPLFGALCALLSWSCRSGRAGRTPLVGLAGAVAIVEATIVLSHTSGRADPTGPLAGFVRFWSTHAGEALFYLRYAPPVWWVTCALGALVHARAAGRSVVVQALAALVGGLLASCLLGADECQAFFDRGRRGLLLFSLALGLGLVPALWAGQRVASRVAGAWVDDDRPSSPGLVGEARLEAAALLPFAALLMGANALLRPAALLLAGAADCKVGGYDDVQSACVRAALLVVVATAAASRWLAGARPWLSPGRGLAGALAITVGLALVELPSALSWRFSAPLLALTLLATVVVGLLLPSSPADRWGTLPAGLGATAGVALGLRLATEPRLLHADHLFDAGPVIAVVGALAGGLAGGCGAACWRGVRGRRRARSGSVDDDRPHLNAHR